MSAASLGGWEPICASVLCVRAGVSLGSGFVATHSGVVVTNHHVVGYRSEVLLRGKEGSDVPARVAFADSRLDVAFLVPARSMSAPPLALGDSLSLVQGQSVSVLGHPLGLSYTLTFGVVSSPRRVVDGVPYIQTDAVMNPGNSGGPVLDDQGRVAGVATWGEAGGTGLGFAVPVDTFIAELQSIGSAVAGGASPSPNYRCHECEGPLDLGADRCRGCGARLRFVRMAQHQSGILVGHGEKVVALLLRHLGLLPNECRVDAGLWRVDSGSAQLLLQIKEDTLHVTARLAKLPAGRLGPLLRFLMTANDQATGAARLSVDEQRIIVLELLEPLKVMTPETASASVRRFQQQAEKLQRLLTENFDTLPAPDVLEATLR